MADSNGISDKILQQAAEEIDGALKKKNLGQIDRIHLQTNKHVLTFLADERSRVKKLEDDLEVVKDHSLLLWAKKHPKLAMIYATLLAIMANAWFVAGFRRPILHALIKNTFGVDIPIDTIP